MQKIFFNLFILIFLTLSCKQKSIETEMDEYCACLNKYHEKKMMDHEEYDLLLREIYSRQNENIDSLNLIEDRKTQCWFQF